MNFLDETLTHMKLLKRIKGQMKRRLEQLPEGRIVKKHANGKVYLYVENNGKMISLLKRPEMYEIYNERNQIEESLSKVERDIPLLDKLVKKYQPITIPDKLWQNLGENQNLYKQENKRHSYGGTYYRSKSEMAIAMMLASYGLEFKYESEVMVDGGKVYPDFAVKRPKDGKVIFWEHFGRIDDEGYRKNMYEKLEKYSNSGFEAWDRLIISFDNDYGSLNGNIIEKLIKVFLLD